MTRVMSPGEHAALADFTMGETVNADWSETPHGAAGDRCARIGVAEHDSDEVKALVDALVGKRVYDTLVEVESVDVTCDTRAATEPAEMARAA